MPTAAGRPRSSPTPNFNCSNGGPRDANSLEPTAAASSPTQVATRARHAPATDEGSSERARLSRLLAVRASGARAGRRRARRDRRESRALRDRHHALAALDRVRVAARRRRSGAACGRSARREFATSSRSIARSRSTSRACAPPSRGASSDELFYLGRLVAGAHNLLYRDDAQHAFATCFASSRSTCRPRCAAPSAPIALAARVPVRSGAIAYTAVVRDPAVAANVHPDADARSRRGRRRAREARRKGYIPDPEVFRPVMASRIIANNVQVTFAAFAFGITAGLGTLALAPPQRRVARRRVRALSVEGTSSRCSSRSSRRTVCSSCRRHLHRRRRGPPHRGGAACCPASARAGARSPRTVGARCTSSPPRRCSSSSPVRSKGWCRRFHSGRSG